MSEKDINDIISIICPNDEDFEKTCISPAYLKKELEVLALEQEPCEDAISRADVEQTVEDNILCYTHSDRPIDQDPDTECDMAIRMALRMLRKDLRKLPSAQPEQRWIPCSDENPKADGRYLITGKMGTVYSLDFEDGRWYGGIKPVAWKPLPEPYREERTEE